MVLLDCNKCQVLLDGGKKRLTGRVLHSRETVKIYFNLTNLKDARIRTQVLFFDDMQGILESVCELVIRRNFSSAAPEPWMADCQILELRRAEDNLRRHVRIKTNLEVEFSSEKHGGFYGTIADLSVGGLQLVTRQLLNRNERIAFTYSFGSQPRTYEAVALRGRALQDGKFTYGCRFVNMTDRGEASIGGYLFKKQQEMRRHEQ